MKFCVDPGQWHCSFCWRTKFRPVQYWCHKEVLNPGSKSDCHCWLLQSGDSRRDIYPYCSLQGLLGKSVQKNSSCINFRSSRCRNDACRRLHRPILAAQILSQRQPVFTPGWSLTGWCFVPVSIEFLSGVNLWFRHWLKSLPIFPCVWPLTVSVSKQTGRERDGKSLMVKNVSNFLFYQFHVRYSLPILVRNKRNGSHFQADKIARMNFPPIHKKTVVKTSDPHSIGPVTICTFAVISMESLRIFEYRSELFSLLLGCGSSFEIFSRHVSYLLSFSVGLGQTSRFTVAFLVVFHFCWIGPGCTRRFSVPILVDATFAVLGKKRC